MRIGIWVACAALVAAVGGCDEDSGIVFRVQDSEQSPPPDDMTRLQFFAAYVDGDGMTQDIRIPLTVADVSGRDLKTSPYDLLITEDSHSGPARQVSVAVVGYKGDTAVAFGIVAAPQAFIEGKVLLRHIDLEGFSGNPPFSMTTNKCLVVGETTFAAAGDRDCDDFLLNVDCNDSNPNINPDATEVCANQVDDDCDQMIDEQTDIDQDGQTNCGGDCDDNNREINSRALEVCDGRDNNCDGKCDDGFDKDSDRHTTCGTKVNSLGMCSVSTPTPALIDCNDENNHVFPGNSEVCDGLDNNCNQKCDDGFDGDNDTYVSCAFDTSRCDGVMRPGLMDCNDGDNKVNPGAKELCNGKDDNCDGRPYPAFDVCFAVANNMCQMGSRPCNDAAGGTGWGQCVTEQTLSPPMAVCDAYGACASNPEPLVCTDTRLAMTAGFRVMRCQVDFIPGVGGNQPSLCPSQKDPLTPPAGSNTCAWDIIGGQMQGPYRVGYASDGGTVVQTVMECPATFQVQSYTPSGALSGLPGRRLFLTLLANGTTSTTYAVELIPNMVTACGADGMRCTTAP